MKPAYFFCLVLLLILCTAFIVPWSNYQPAQYVIGQSYFKTYSSGSGQTKLNWADGVAIDIAHNKLYVADSYNNRLLRYSYPVTGNQPTADLVFGQADFASTNENRGLSPAANTIRYPGGIEVSNGDLWVADCGNSRVLKFGRADTITQNGPSADVVLGQSAFNTMAAATSQSGMDAPMDVFVDGDGRLWVTDQNNNRVLRFDNASSKSTGANADGVLGQALFTTKTAQTTRDGMRYPVCVYVSGLTLWVTDEGNHRVLRFDSAASKSDGANASGVLGQSDFISGSSGTSQSTFYNPYGICVDGSGRLYVAEEMNNRVMIFENASSKSNGANADKILGQPNWISSSAVQDSLGFYWPGDIAVDVSNNRLLVSDIQDSRIMQFQASSPLPVELVSFEAVATGGGVVLNWRTATEVNNFGFEVQRRQTGTPLSVDWQAIGFVKGTGTSSSPREYSFTDKCPSPGIYAYRIKQVNKDGSFVFTAERQVEATVPREFALRQNFPNPFNPTTTVQFTVPNNGRATLTVYDALGKQVAVLFDGETESGRYYEAKFGGNDIAAGVYLARLTFGHKQLVRKLLLVK